MNAPQFVTTTTPKTIKLRSLSREMRNAIAFSASVIQVPVPTSKADTKFAP